MFRDLDGLIREEINHFSHNKDELNNILIALYNVENSLNQNTQKQLTEQLFQEIEKLQSNFESKYKEIQENIKNLIADYKVRNSKSCLIKNIAKRKQVSPVLGIDLGTSNSTVGYYRINAKGRGEMEIVANEMGKRAIPSVVCIVNNEIYVGKEAIHKSSKYPKNLIYDSKRMLGRKFDDPLIQEYRKHWTFDTVKSKTGGILISVDNKLYEPYEISGMILTELVNLANSHLETNINQAIITIPAYFDQMQIDDTRRAAKYANIEIIQLLDEQLAATICYKNNYNSVSSERNKNVLVYDFGGGTLDVSYVEIEGSSFNVLAAAGDSGLGGQDFTNSIFDIISPKLEKMCKPEWKKDSWFLSLITNQCETAKISLTRLNEVEIYFEIPKNLSKSRENTFEYRLRREEFEEKTKELFDRCTAPVIDVLKRVGRNPFDIESLVLVGGSSYLPKIVKKLYELTQKKAYHGVSPVEAVAYGACAFGGQYIQNKMNEFGQKELQDQDRFLHDLTIQTTAPLSIDILKYFGDKPSYFTVFEKGSLLPNKKEVLLNSDEVYRNPNSNTVIIEVFSSDKYKKTKIGDIPFQLSSKDNFAYKSPLAKINFYQDQGGIQYAIKRPTEKTYPSYQKLEMYEGKESKYKREFNRKDSRDHSRLSSNPEKQDNLRIQDKLPLQNENNLEKQGINNQNNQINQEQFFVQVEIKKSGKFSPISEKATALPYEKEMFLFRNEIEIKENTNIISLPVRIYQQGVRIEFENIQFEITQKDINLKPSDILRKIYFIWDKNVLKYAVKEQKDINYPDMKILEVKKEENEQKQSNENNNDKEKEQIDSQPKNDAECEFSNDENSIVKQPTLLGLIYIVIYQNNIEKHITIFYKNTPFPTEKEVVLNSNDVKIVNASFIYISVFIILDSKKIKLGEVVCDAPSKEFTNVTNEPYLKIKFVLKEKSLLYQTKRFVDNQYLEMKKIDFKYNVYKKPSKSNITKKIQQEKPTNQKNQPQTTTVQVHSDNFFYSGHYYSNY